MPVNHANHNAKKQEMQNAINNITNYQKLESFIETYDDLDFIFTYKDIATALTTRVIGLIDNGSLDIHDLCKIFIEHQNKFARQQLLEKLPEFLQEKFDSYEKSNQQEQQKIIKDLESTNKQLRTHVQGLEKDLAFKIQALKEGKSLGKKRIKSTHKSSKISILEGFKKDLNTKYEELIASLEEEKIAENNKMISISKKLEKEIESFKDDISKNQKVQKWINSWLEEKRDKAALGELEAMDRQLAVTNELAPMMLNLNATQKEKYVDLLITFQQKIFSPDATLADNLNTGNSLIQELRELVAKNSSNKTPSLMQAINNIERDIQKQQAETNQILSENEILTKLSNSGKAIDNELFSMIANQKTIDSAKKFIQSEIKDYSSLDNFVANFIDERTKEIPEHLLSVTNAIKETLTNKLMELIKQNPTPFKGDFIYLSQLLALKGVSKIINIDELIKENIFEKITSKMQEDLEDVSLKLAGKENALIEHLDAYAKNIATLQEKNDKAVKSQLKDIRLLDAKIAITAKKSLKYKLFGKGIKLLSKMGILNSFDEIQRSRIDNDGLSKIKTDYLKELSDEKFKKEIDIKRLKGDYTSEKLELQRDFNNALSAKKEELSSELFNKYLESYKERKEQAVYTEEYKFLEENHAKLTNMLVNSRNLDVVTKVFKEIYKSTKEELAKNKHGHLQAKRELRKALPLSKKFIQYLNDLNGSINKLRGLFWNTRKLDNAQSVVEASQQSMENSDSRNQDPRNSVLAKLREVPRILAKVAVDSLNPSLSETIDTGTPKSTSTQEENFHDLFGSSEESSLSDGASSDTSSTPRPISYGYPGIGTGAGTGTSRVRSYGPRPVNGNTPLNSSKRPSSPQGSSVLFSDSGRDNHLSGESSVDSKKSKNWRLMLGKANGPLKRLRKDSTVIYSEGLLKKDNISKIKTISSLNIEEIELTKLSGYHKVKYSLKVNDNDQSSINIELSLRGLNSRVDFNIPETLNLITLKEREIAIISNDALTTIVNKAIPSSSKEFDDDRLSLINTLKSLRDNAFKEIIKNSYNSQISMSPEAEGILVNTFSSKKVMGKSLNDNNLKINFNKGKEDDFAPRVEAHRR